MTATASPSTTASGTPSSSRRPGAWRPRSAPRATASSGSTSPPSAVRRSLPTSPCPSTAEPGEGGIPVTYVPARNTVLLALLLALAEVVDARDLFLGVNAVDYSGYPDCRPAFLAAFERLARVATAAGTERGATFRVRAPLLDLAKADIIRRGVAARRGLRAHPLLLRPRPRGGRLRRLRRLHPAPARVRRRGSPRPRSLHGGCGALAWRAAASEPYCTPLSWP